jgi:hypothetical protein
MQHLKGNLGIGLAAHRAQLAGGQLWPLLGNIKPAIGREASQQDIDKSE